MPQERKDQNQPENVASHASARSIAIAEWIHRHQDITSKNPLGYTGYQYLRSAIASVPYGLSMAGTWLAFEKVAQSSAKNPSLKYLNMFTTSPLVRTGFMIGTSFTLYRATSKICKWVQEYLFNPEDTLQETVDKVEHLPEMIRAKVKEVYLPEGHATLISAFVLSSLVLYGQNAAKSEHLTQALAETKEMLGGTHRFNGKAWKHFWKEAIHNPKSNFVAQAAVNSLAYSLFFELGDRRFKDKQVSRGMWAGGVHSIGSSSRSHPSLLQESLHPDDEATQVDATVETTAAGDLPEGSRMGDKLSVLTSEPSALRFFTRRFIPTAAGITAYTALKFRGGKLFFGDFPAKDITTVKGFLRNAYAEGAATSLFFMIPWVTDKYAPVHDKVVNRMEAAASGRSVEQVMAGHQPDVKVQKPADYQHRIAEAPQQEVGAQL